MEAFVKSRSGKESKGSSVMVARKEKLEELPYLMNRREKIELKQEGKGMSRSR